MRSSADILDPALYARARAPHPVGEGLPPWCYTSAEWYRAEVARIFMKAWNCIGRVERVAEPGDYLAFELVGVPLVVVRGRDGELRAFANSCRHRGALLLEGTGNCRAVRCPYHGWVYGLDGRLVGAPEMEATRAFDPADWGLVPIRLETWAGFMFVSFDPDAAPLGDCLGDLPAKLAPYRLDRMVPTYRREYELACNWKVLIENANEYYHTPMVHPTSIYPRPVGFLGQKGGGMTVLANESGHGAYNFFFMPHEGTRSLLPGDVGFEAMDHLPGRLRHGSYFGFVFPTLHLSCHNDAMWFFEIWPQGPGRTRVAQVGCFPPAAVARPDFEEVAARYIRRWELTSAEDIAINERVQRGLAGPFARAGPVCQVEDKVHIFRRMVLDRVLGDEAAA